MPDSQAFVACNAVSYLAVRDLRELIESSYIFGWPNLHSSPTPDKDGGSPGTTVLRSDGLPCRRVLVRGQLDRSLVEVGVYGVWDLDFAGVIALALRSC